MKKMPSQGQVAPNFAGRLAMNHIDLNFYSAVFLRRFRPFVAIVVLVATIGCAVALYLPPIYQADARILIEAPQIPTELVRSTVSTEASKQLQLIELQLMTRTDVVPLANQFGLYGSEKYLSADQIVEDMRSRTKITPIESSISQDRGATAFTVSFSADDPVIAANVVNEYVKLMLQRSTRLRSAQARDTLYFFQDETKKLTNQLEQVESKILTFKKENKDALPESLGFRRNQQISLQERLLQIDREEATLRDERSRLARVSLNSGRDFDPNTMTPKERTLEQFRRVLAEQRSVFAETSSGIVSLRSQIADLEKEVQAEKANPPATAFSTRRASEMDMRLAELTQRLNLLAQEKVTISENLANLAKSIAATPGIETELNALERERQNIQTQYGIVAARLADATAGQQLELGSKGERLSVLETAIPPLFPIGPKRRLIAAGSLAAGIAFGIGFIILMELLNRTIRRPTELVEKLEIEPLATIPYIGAPPTRIRSLNLKNTATLLAFVIVPAFLIMLSHYQLSMRELLSHLSQEQWIRRLF